MTLIKINQNGSFNLPTVMRKKFGLEKGGRLKAEVSNKGLLLKPVMAYPLEMYTDARVKEFGKGETELKLYLKKRGI